MRAYGSSEADRLNALGARLREGFDRAFAQAGFDGAGARQPARCPTSTSPPTPCMMPGTPSLRWCAPATSRRFCNLGMIRRGVVSATRLMYCVSTAMTERDIDFAVTALHETPQANCGPSSNASARRCSQPERLPALRLMALEPLSADVLPDGIRSRFVPNINGLRMHVLEAGSGPRPGVVLLHGFPGTGVQLAPRDGSLGRGRLPRHRPPDLRGYGRTTGWDADFDGDLASFRRLNIVRDVTGLVAAYGFRTAAVVGHDFGSPIAAWCALVRPDVFTAVALMSAPFGGTGALPFATVGRPPSVVPEPAPNLADELAALPRPRKHYQHYYQTRAANARHVGRAARRPRPFCAATTTTRAPIGKTTGRSASPPGRRREMAGMPTYYIMDLADGMAATVAKTHAVRLRNRSQRLAAGRRTGRLRRGIRPHRIPGRSEPLPLRRHRSIGTGALRRPHHRPAVGVHRGRQRLGAATKVLGPWSGCKRKLAPICGACIWLTALATGCNRSRRRRPPDC